nr:YidB family protein [uncultured Streptomyces sp.]
MAGNDLGSLLGGLLGGGRSGGATGGATGGGAGAILGSLLGALGGTQGGGAGNGLEGLIGILTKSGLADQAQSWIGTGGNEAVTGQQIARALPEETLRKVADESGVSPQEAADEIAQHLPETVDKLTPTGQVPQGGSLEDIVREQAL